MAFTVTDLGNNSGFSSGFGSIFLSQAIPAGSLILVTIADGGTTPASVTVTDDASNSYVKIGQTNNNNSAANGSGSVWLSLTTAPLTSSDHIYTTTDSTNLGGVGASLITGFDPAKVLLGVFASAFGNSSNPTVSVTPNYANSLMIGFAADVSRGSFTVDDFTQDPNFSTPPIAIDGNAGADAVASIAGCKTQVTIASVTYNPAPLTFGGPWSAFLLEIPALAAAAETRLFTRQLRY